QVVGLVGEAGPPAARIALLQADDVVRTGELGNRVQGAALVARGQDVRPAAYRVVAVAARAGAGLDVRAEQLEFLVRHRAPARGITARWRAPWRSAGRRSPACS